MFYFVFHLEETDGDITCKMCKDQDAVDNYIKINNLTSYDYYVVHGTLIK